MSLIFDLHTLSLVSLTLTFPVPRQEDNLEFARAFPIFGSFGNEPMQSCSVRRVSLSLSSSASVSVSVYSPPSDRFDHRSFISYKYMQLCP